MVGGAFFAALMNGITWVQRRYTDFDPGRVEEFSSASRSVKTGMYVNFCLPRRCSQVTRIQVVGRHYVCLGLGSRLSANGDTHLPLWHLRTVVVWYGRIRW